MLEDQAREDIAFIRRAIEEGGAYATASSPDMLVWGIAVAIGYLGTYGFIRGWSPIAPGSLWAACLGLPWLFSLRRMARGLAGREVPSRGPMAQARAMLWFACGVFLTTLAIAATVTGEARNGWCDAVVVMGIGFLPAPRSPGCRGCAGSQSRGGWASWRSSPCTIVPRRCHYRRR